MMFSLARAVSQLSETASRLFIAPFQVRAARAILGLGVRDLAAIAGISPATLTRFEKYHGGLQAATLQRIVMAIEDSGIEIIQNGVRLKPVEPPEEETETTR